MKKALISLVAAAPLLAMGLAQTKVSVWYHEGQGSERDAIEASIKRFNAANKDIQADLIFLPGGSYNDQVNAAALADKLPCVLDFDGPFAYNYAWSGKLIPIDKYVSADVKKDFLSSVIRQGTYNGKLYSLGQIDSGLGIWGNKEMLEKAGVRIPKGIADAWTGDEFLAVLDKLQKGGLKTPIDMKFNYGVGEWFTYGFSPIIQSFGGDLINRNGYKTATGAINGPEAIAGMNYFKKLLPYTNTKPAGDTDFVDGKAALSFVGHWTYPDYLKGLGNKLVLLPMPKFGKKATTGMGSWNFGLTSDCKVQDAAAKVLLHLVSPEETLALSNANGAVPARKSAIAKSRNYAKGGPLAIYVDQLDEDVALERPVTPAYPTITKAFAEAVNNIVGGADVKAELDKAARKIDQDIADNKGYPVK